jgi:hypothetical protein
VITPQATNFGSTLCLYFLGTPIINRSVGLLLHCVYSMD